MSGRSLVERPRTSNPVNARSNRAGRVVLRASLASDVVVPRVRLLVHPGVSKVVERELRRATRDFAAILPIGHPMSIEVVPHQAVAGTYALGFASLEVPPTLKYGGELRVTVGAGLYGVLRKLGDTRTEAALGVVESFAHELAHYEQWRDGRPTIERGVAVRTRTLMRRLLVNQGRSRMEYMVK